LIATDTYKPTINGVVTSVLNLEKGLRELGHEVKVVTLSQTAQSYYENSVYYIGSIDMSRIYPDARVKTPIVNRKERLEIIDWQPDVIHTQSEFSTFLIARKIAKKLDIPIIHTYHTKYEDYTHYFIDHAERGKKIVTIATHYLSEHVKGIIAPTRKIATLLEGYKVECATRVIPTGIELEKYKRVVSEESIAKLKENLKIAKDNLVLVSISRVGKEKNIAELIRYVKSFKRDNVSLLIVGDGPERKALQKLVGSLNLTEQIKFTGMIRPNEIAAYYQLGDLFVSASTSETQGLTYIEALANGTPILCREDECLEGLVEEGVTGYSFVSETDFHQKLLDFMDVTDKDEMKAAAKRVADKYSISNFARSVAEFYNTYV